MSPPQAPTPPSRRLPLLRLILRPKLAFATASIAVFMAAPAHAQTRIPVTPRTGSQADGPTNGQSQVQTSGTPRAPLDPAAAAAVANGSAFPGIPPVTPPIYLRRPAPLCSDFQPVANGGWAALGPIQFPGPQGPVQMVVGQTVVPGDYLDGMDLGSLLQRDCPRRPVP